LEALLFEDFALEEALLVFFGDFGDLERDLALPAICVL